MDDCDDDTSIEDGCELYRRIPPYQVVSDDSTEGVGPSSANFDDQELSVAAEDKLIEAGREPIDILMGHAGFGLVGFKAGLARECELKIVRDPKKEEPAHALVVGKKTGKKRSIF
ncbi:MAG: hypothetical protein U5S82_06995 [Gammaproteobacteria bacterium]|nr:hypothetical protein [Gammaproteobacteria bacterium]